VSPENPQIWFPEPSLSDDTFARREETTSDWLARSTNPRARDCRRFLNEHLSRFPSENQAKFAHDLREKWHSTFFELIVARILQELGGSIVVESPNPDLKRPDFSAKFSDAIVTVEAKAPIVNGPALAETRTRTPLLNFIESNTPGGWLVGVWELPNVGLADSKKAFMRKVKKMLKVPPPGPNESERELIAELPQGTIHLHLFPTGATHGRLGFDAPIFLVDNTRARILTALKSKKRQVRNSQSPVLLAILASGHSSDLEDFDVALFGHSFERYDQNRRLVERGFTPNGIFNQGSGTSPTYAGVLAFLKADFHCCSEPVLYRHPRFSGSLPKAILNLEQRSFDQTRNEIHREPPSTGPLTEALNLVSV
jgi:hypothetical protein